MRKLWFSRSAHGIAVRAVDRRTVAGKALVVAGLSLAGLVAWQINAARARSEVPVKELIGKSSHLATHFAPDLDKINLEAMSLMVGRPGQKSERVWCIEMMDSNDQYVGHTVWRAADGELVRVAWRPITPEVSASRLSILDVHALARESLSMLDIPGYGEAWKVTGTPRRDKFAWKARCKSGDTRYTVRLDGKGRLISAEQEPRA